MTNFSRMLRFWSRYGKGKRYPRVLCFSRHKEFGCYTLHPPVSLQDLKEGLRFAMESGGNFCLAVHYWALIEDNRLFDTFTKFLSYIKTLEEEIKYVEADRLFD